jgi:hypothetical protein
VATVASNNGQLVLHIPSDFFATPTGGGPETVDVRIIPTGAPTNSSGGTSIGPDVPFLTLEMAVSIDGGPPISGTPFAEPLLLTVRYDPAQVKAAGLVESQLKIFLLMDDGTATALPSTVDLANHTVSAQIPHLTLVILAGPAGVVYIPVAFQQATESGW